MPKRALVLGGGGPVGIAWESGLLAGFAEGGVSLENADFIAGTSAGSFVGAQIALGKAAAALVTPIMAEEAPTQRAGSSSAQPSGPAPDLTTLIAKMGEAVSGKRPAKEVRAEIGKWALEVKTISEEAFLAGFGRSFNELPDDLWPDRDYACTRSMRSPENLWCGSGTPVSASSAPSPPVAAFPEFSHRLRSKAGAM
jgi:NTE family protein